MTVTARNIINTWPKVSGVLRVPHTRVEYDRLLGLLDELTDEVGNDEGHPLSSLMETIGVLVGDFEERNYRMKDTGGIAALRYLMKEHGLRQSDLTEIGSQGVVSEVLRGKRELNLRQVKSLAKRFSVSPSVFI